MKEDMQESVRQAHEYLARNEQRLGIFIPTVMMDLLTYVDLRYFSANIQKPFTDKCDRWTNATIDGFLDFADWEFASGNDWFESISDIPALDHLVIIAAHSEAQLCLDYREKGLRNMPKVIYIEVDFSPTDLWIISDNAEEFATTVLKSVKTMDDNY